MHAGRRQGRFWLLWGQNWCFCVQRDTGQDLQVLGLIAGTQKATCMAVCSEPGAMAELGLSVSTVTSGYSKRMGAKRKPSRPVTGRNLSLTFL